jgi:hypothetical protein
LREMHQSSSPCSSEFAFLMLYRECTNEAPVEGRQPGTTQQLQCYFLPLPLQSPRAPIGRRTRFGSTGGGSTCDPEYPSLRCPQSALLYCSRACVHVADNCNSALSSSIASITSPLLAQLDSNTGVGSHYFQSDRLESYKRHHQLFCLFVQYYADAACQK